VRRYLLRAGALSRGAEHSGCALVEIMPLPGMTERPRIFRLAEHAALVLAHPSVKEACERAGITGVGFTPTTEYV
jgi:hypothetical protein